MQFLNLEPIREKCDFFPNMMQKTPQMQIIHSQAFICAINCRRDAKFEQQIPGEQRGKTLSMVKNNENDQLSTTLNINSGLDSFFVFLPLPSSLTSTHSILRFNPLFVMNLFRFFFHEKIGFISGLCHGFKMLSVSQKFCFRTFFFISIALIIALNLQYFASLNLN